MRIASAGHAVFAATMIVLGIIGLIQADFTPVWAPVPPWAPMRGALIWLCALVSLGCGVGLLLQRSAAPASRVLLAALLLWLLLFRVPPLVLAPTSQDSISGWGETSTIVAAAWVLYAWFASAWDRQRFRFAAGESGVRIARILYGVALLIFGEAHLRYAKETAGLVPSWLPMHLGWAYFTGIAFIAAGVAILAGVRARLAAILSAWQLGLFTLLVWLPMMARHPNAFQLSEFGISCAITAAAWVLADSYGERARLAFSAVAFRVSS